jgi:hypothetical protein
MLPPGKGTQVSHWIRVLVLDKCISGHQIWFGLRAQEKIVDLAGTRNQRTVASRYTYCATPASEVQVPET